MKPQILRVFPRRTAITPNDEMAFIGNPPLWRPEAEEVHVSATFTWDRHRALELGQAWGQYYPVVKVGGPAFGSATNGFTSGCYVRSGVTFTSRGCNHCCPWCLVPEIEGRLRPLRDIEPGHIIQDNNFLQCPREHRQKVYAMLAEQSPAAVFSGGLEAALVTEEIAAELQDIRIDHVFLAADTAMALKPLERAMAKLQFLPRAKLRCYVLIAFNGERIEEAQRRLEAVWDLGCLPFAQLFQPNGERQIKYSDEWRVLNRKWCRPAIMKASGGRP